MLGIDLEIWNRNCVPNFTHWLSWKTLANRKDAVLPESTYHSHMSLLFEFEFVTEAQLLNWLVANQPG